MSGLLCAPGWVRCADMRAPSTKTVVGLGVAGVGVLGWASLIERNAFVLQALRGTGAAAGGGAAAGVHLSDIHLLPRQNRKAEWLRRLESLDPDFIVNTGDNSPATMPCPPCSTPLGAAGPAGRLRVGSNDYFAPKVKNPLRYLTRHHAKGAGETDRCPPPTSSTASPSHAAGST